MGFVDLDQGQDLGRRDDRGIHARFAAVMKKH